MSTDTHARKEDYFLLHICPFVSYIIYFGQQTHSRLFTLTYLFMYYTLLQTFFLLISIIKVLYLKQHNSSCEHEFINYSQVPNAQWITHLSPNLPIIPPITHNPPQVTTSLNNLHTSFRSVSITQNHQFFHTITVITVRKSH